MYANSPVYQDLIICFR